MTCIIAIEEEGVVYMGSDAAASGDGLVGIVTSPKVFHNGPLLIGYTDSFRMGQLLQYTLEAPIESMTWDVDRWVSVDLMAAVRTCFEENGYEVSKEGRVEGGQFLVAVAGRCYEVQDDYSALRYSSGEYSVGAGASHAMGSLHSTREWEDQWVRLEAALDAATEHVLGVDPPFFFAVQESE